MRGDEARVVDAFCRWLEAEGWQVDREVDFVDVKAHRGADVLYAEAKGRTAAAGLDIDTLYGQLLRRMPPGTDEHVRFGVVVPAEIVHHALRVPPRVRDLLHIDVYSVTAHGEIIRAR